MRIYSALLVATMPIRQDVQLLEVHEPTLIQAIQPGQFCMLRCSASDTSDPLLRRPFYVHGINRNKGTCTFYVNVQGRGSSWLANQPVGVVLDILGPLGHGWTLRPTIRTALLIAEERTISALTLLAQVALEQDIAVTLINNSQSLEASYPPALFSPEIEYQVVSNQSIQNGQIEQTIQEGTTKSKKRAKKEQAKSHEDNVTLAVDAALPWADAVFSSVSHETLLALYTRFERLHVKDFAQAAITRPLVCGMGTCFACTIETRVGQKLVCREGPIFDMRDVIS